MQEKEKLEQPKLVEVEKVSTNPANYSTSNSDTSDLLTTIVLPKTTEQSTKEKKPESAAYGDLEEDNQHDSPTRLKPPAYLERQQFYQRAVARIIDCVVVTTIATAFYVTVMTVVVFTGGDPDSLRLAEIQQGIKDNTINTAIQIWFSTLCYTMIPGMLFVELMQTVTHARTLMDFASFFLAALGPVVQIVYQTVYISGRKQATIGKMITGICIVDLDAKPLTPSRALVRELLFSLDFVFFFMPTVLREVIKKIDYPRPLHDLLTGATSVERRAGLSKGEQGELIPIGLAFLSIAIMFSAGAIFEHFYGDVAESGQVETARKLFGAESETHLRQLWRYTKKRIDAGEYNKPDISEKEFQDVTQTIQTLAKHWGNEDTRVAALYRPLLFDSPIAKYPIEHEKLLIIATDIDFTFRRHNDYLLNGDLCQIYLGKIRNSPSDKQKALYQKVYLLSKYFPHGSVDNYKMTAAFLKSAEALGHESALRNAIQLDGLQNLSIDGLEDLHLTYWDYRLYKLILADEFVRYQELNSARMLVSGLLNLEEQPANEARISTPRDKPSLLEEKVLKSLSQEFPALTKKLKPSYWKPIRE